MSQHLSRAVERLRNMSLKLFAAADEAVRKAVSALEDRNLELAQDVMASDVAIDDMEVEIEEECLKILALHQPVAIDLRRIVAIFRFNSDLERIGDLAVNLAERARALVGHPEVEIPGLWTDMAKRTLAMLRQARDSLINLDADLAREIRAADDAVDALHRRMYAISEADLRKPDADVTGAIQLMDAARFLERIADHATNIAEDVIYVAEGEIVRHRADEKK
jgi:phosphate transport system protein